MKTQSRERGVALIVALVLLIVVTLLGVAGLRTVTLEEKMAAATYDRNIAFQAAEAALRIGESIAETQSKLAQPNSGFPTYTDSDDNCPATWVNNCNNGLCSIPDKDCTPRWEDPSFDDNSWKNATEVSASAGTPQYFVEYLGNDFPCNNDISSDTVYNCKRYRITARSRPGGDDRATVILQSIYATD
jgi:type IV pilus assembly protein PilX